MYGFPLAISCCVKISNIISKFVRYIDVPLFKAVTLCYYILILSLHCKAILANIRLRPLRHKRSSGYTEHQAQLYTKLQFAGARGTFIIHFSYFCKNKIDNGWLAEREDPKKLKESSSNIATISNWCYNKSWCLFQNGRRKCN